MLECWEGPPTLQHFGQHEREEKSEVRKRDRERERERERERRMKGERDTGYLSGLTILLDVHSDVLFDVY